MKYYILLGLVFSSLLFSEIVTPVFNSALEQKTKVLELLEKETKSIEAVVEELSDIDLLQKIIQKKKQDQIQLCIVTKNIKKNKIAIDLLKENQIEVLFFEARSLPSNLSFIVMESNQIVWVGTKLIFKKYLRNQTNIESLMINDKLTAEKFAGYFAKIKERLK